MYHSSIKTVRDLRNNTADVFKALDAHDHVIITKHGKGKAVLIDYADYSAYEEYLHTAYVREKLAESKKEAENPDTARIGHEEFWHKVDTELL